MLRPVKPVAFHKSFLALVEHIERTFPVTRWALGDVPVWPLARQELHLNMHFASLGAQRPALREFPWRGVANAALPLKNLWRSRRDLPHLSLRPRPADAIVLGNGVTLDWVDGAYRDRFAEPIIAALEAQGRKTFLMQSGDLRRLPWQRATYPANLIASRGAGRARAIGADAQLPAHEAVLEYLAARGVAAPSLERSALQRLAARVAGMASSFETVLEVVKPSLAFVVTYYSGLGPAFVLACRRRRILSVDLQHCPQDGAHKAYRFAALPRQGYDVLPDAFWNWTQHDLEYNQRWAALAEAGRHRAIHGGHAQIAALLDKHGELAQNWQQAFAAAAGGVHYAQEILIALQPLGGHGGTWEALRAAMEAAPASWRWWIRRHPATGAGQDHEYASLLETCKNPVVVDAASALPLPALLPHMSALVSVASGAAAEAAAFGVPAFFLDESARETFGELIERGHARVIDVRDLNVALAGNAPLRRRTPPAAPVLATTLSILETWAREHAKLAGCFQPYNYTRPDRYPWLFDFARTQLAAAAPLHLLSFGCSRGDEVFSLQRYFPRATIKGVDVDPRNVAQCLLRSGAKNSALTFATAATTQDEPDAHYDAIFCLAVLCCGDLTVSEATVSTPRLAFEDFERVVTDFVRCLKVGGLLLLHTTNFRFGDTASAARCETVLEAQPSQMAPDRLYDRDGQWLQGEQYRAVAFRKTH